MAHQRLCLDGYTQDAEHTWWHVGDSSGLKPGAGKAMKRLGSPEGNSIKIQVGLCIFARLDEKVGDRAAPMVWYRVHDRIDVERRHPRLGIAR